MLTETVPPDPPQARPVWENLALYAGIDGSRGPEDLGINANLGSRVALQTAFPLLEAWGVGMQVGSSINNHENATHFLRLNGGPGSSLQVFSTLGLFQRTEGGLKWGLAYDYLNYQGYTNINLAQWRGQLGYQWDPQNEYGVWGTWRDRGDTAHFAGETFALRGINQANLFWTHFWPTQAMTKAWAGVAENHGEAILGVPGNSRSNHPFIFGTSLQIPLNDHIALYGEANFITPTDSGTVHAFLGFVYYPGGTTTRALSTRFAPLLPLANNPNFAQDVRRQ